MYCQSGNTTPTMEQYMSKISFPLAFDPIGGRIVDSTGRLVAFLDADVDDLAGLELIGLANRAAEDREPVPAAE